MKLKFIKFSEREIIAVLTQARNNIEVHNNTDFRLIAAHQSLCLDEAIKCVRSVCRRKKK